MLKKCDLLSLEKGELSRDLLTVFQQLMGRCREDEVTLCTGMHRCQKTQDTQVASGEIRSGYSKNNTPHEGTVLGNLLEQGGWPDDLQKSHLASTVL